MCRSMADIQSATADIRRGIKKKKPQDKKYHQCPHLLSRAAIKIMQTDLGVSKICTFKRSDPILGAPGIKVKISFVCIALCYELLISKALRYVSVVVVVDSPSPSSRGPTEFLCRDPNSPDLPVWPQYTVQSRRHLEFGGPYNFSAGQALRSDYCDVWRSINRQLQHSTSHARLT